MLLYIMWVNIQNIFTKLNYLSVVKLTTSTEYYLHFSVVILFPNNSIFNVLNQLAPKIWTAFCEQIKFFVIEMSRSAVYVKNTLIMLKNELDSIISVSFAHHNRNTLEGLFWSAGSLCCSSRPQHLWFFFSARLSWSSNFSGVWSGGSVLCRTYTWRQKITQMNRCNVTA